MVEGKGRWSARSQSQALWGDEGGLSEFVVLVIGGMEGWRRERV